MRAAQRAADIPTDASRPAERGTRAAARIVGRSSFESELSKRCKNLDADASTSPGGFAVLLLRLRRADRRIKLFATERADAVLREVMEQVALVLHDDDRVTACSRDEVAILLAKDVGEGTARLVADRILRALGRLSIGASLRPQIGVAIAPTAGRSVEQILSAVDVACDAAAAAHPRFVLATPDMADHDDDAHLPVLHRVLDTHLLDLAFQPQYDLRSGTWTTVEALVRWPHAPEANPLSPARMIDLAERHGMMDGLARLVLDTAIGHADAFRQLGLHLDVAVNLSPSMMINTALPDCVEQMLARWNVPARCLVLEMSADPITTNSAVSMGVMGRLREIGVRLSIDDFGGAPLSLAGLRDMPLAELKIDRQFVAVMANRREDQQIVRSVIELARNFDLRTVAVGVEDTTTFEALREMGCDAVQGYVCALPMGAEELLRWWPDRPHAGLDVR